MPDLQAAAKLITDGAITRVKNDRSFKVRSQSDADLRYVVTLGDDIAPRCDCPAHGLCKHITAVVALDQAARAEADEAIVYFDDGDGDPC